MFCPAAPRRARRCAPTRTFTGSSHVGRRIGELAGKHLKKVQLELGGKNAVIVLEDTDIGCLRHRLRRLVPSRPDLHDHRTHPGAEQDRRRVDREGPFYKPTALTSVKPGMRAFDEEIFGPVAAITSIGSDDEAIELANHNEYGLSAGVFSADVGRAIAVGNRLNTGLLHINDQTVADEPHIPFGGSGASGNGTRIGGPANWDEFTQWQWMTIKDKPNPYPF
jgi:benzaldehyde dehydrogenase (NAD)